MAFAHSDYYHSGSTLQSMSDKLFSQGILKKSEKERLDEYIYASEKFKIGGKPFRVHAPAEKESKDLTEVEEEDDSPQKHVVRDMKKTYGDDKYLFAKTRSAAEKVVQSLGKYIASEGKRAKQDCLADLLLALKIEPTREKMTPRSERRSPRRTPASASAGGRRVIYFSDLRESEKEKYLTFLVENNVKFWKEPGPEDGGDGLYTATIRLEPQNEKKQSKKKSTGTPKSAQKKMTWKQQKMASEKLTKGESLHLYARHAGRPPAEEQRLVGAMYGNGGGEESGGEFASYQTFSRLITMKDRLKPRKRPITWLMRLIEEIYDARFIHDSADFKDDGTSVPGEQSKQRLSHQFPVFVVDFFSKRYGLRNIVDQNCWDLLFNVNMYREKHLEVAVFGRFLEEFYDPDDLLFFLYVRSVIQKEIGINFRNHWNELGRRGLEDTVWLSYSSCVKVSRVVFVSESDPLFQAFMDMIETRDSDGEYKHLWGKVTRKSDTRRIQVIQFLHLALAEYHSTRPAEGEDEAADQTRRAERAAGVDSFGIGSSNLIRSKEEQDRLFKEAEEQFERKQRENTEGEGGDDDDDTAAAAKREESDATRQRRIKEIEDRIRADIRQSRLAAETEADDSAGEDGTNMLIEAISQAVEQCNQDYLERLMRELHDTSLPNEIKDEIRKEVGNQLDGKVEKTLEAVVDAAMASDDGDNELVNKFRDCRGLPEGQHFRSRVRDFCESVVNSHEVSQEIEPLVTLLITYALQNYDSGGAPADDAGDEKNEDAETDIRRPHEHVHISRSGSIDIRMD